ncbi:MAG: hypothetical protein BGO26_09325 [Actinobacteria bacterium 69-20]|nr:MAG: hypothetical protein BGO26_09325 [Actinobacteria bacterium 69-20]
MLLASACSGTVAAGNTSDPSASVTQTAPSVWSAPDTTPAPTVGATGGTSAGTAGGADSTLPGLSAACSAAIRAQAAVTDLFAAALKGSTASVSGSTSAPISTSTSGSVSGTAAASGTKPTATGRTAAPTAGSSAAPQSAASPTPTASPAPSTGTGKPSGITQADVTATFDEIAKHLPGPLLTPFGVLRDAANKIAGKSAHDVPDVLADAQVSNALKAIADYITACQPPTTN